MPCLPMRSWPLPCKTQWSAPLTGLADGKGHLHLASSWQWDGGRNRVGSVCAWNHSDIQHVSNDLPWNAGSSFSKEESLACDVVVLPFLYHHPLPEVAISSLFPWLNISSFLHQGHMLPHTFVFGGYSHAGAGWIVVYCCCSVAKLRLTLCNPVDCSTPGFPVHYLPEFAQTRVHWVCDSI